MLLSCYGHGHPIVNMPPPETLVMQLRHAKRPGTCRYGRRYPTRRGIAGFVMPSRPASACTTEPSERLQSNQRGGRGARKEPRVGRALCRAPHDIVADRGVSVPGTSGAAGRARATFTTGQPPLVLLQLQPDATVVYRPEGSLFLLF
jgi:hypothetical protein